MSGQESEKLEGRVTEEKSRKEVARQKRREAYLRAKEMKKQDPREIERKAQMKLRRRAVYEEAKARRKELLKQREAAVKQLDEAPLIAEDGQPLAKVIPINIAELRRRQAKRKR